MEAPGEASCVESYSTTQRLLTFLILAVGGVRSRPGAARERTRGDSASGRAVAWRDQHLAQMFYECEWTQQEIADEEGMSREWVSKRLIFGRFCEFLGTTVPKLPVNLTEGKFREFWSTYDGNAKANTPAETKKACHNRGFRED